MEKEIATHSSILALENPMDRGAWQAIVYGVTESDMNESLSLYIYIYINLYSLCKFYINYLYKFINMHKHIYI